MSLISWIFHCFKRDEETRVEQQVDGSEELDLHQSSRNMFGPANPDQIENHPVVHRPCVGSPRPLRQTSTLIVQSSLARISEKSEPSETASSTGGQLLELCYARNESCSAFSFLDAQPLRHSFPSQSSVANVFAQLYKCFSWPVVDHRSSLTFLQLVNEHCAFARCTQEPHLCLTCKAEVDIWTDTQVWNTALEKQESTEMVDEWYTSSDSEGRLYYYEENSNESLWTLPKISSTPQYVDHDTRPGIQQGVFYPEGSHFHPPSKSKTPSVTVSVYDPPQPRTFKEFTKADRNIKTRSMAILTNFSGNVEDIPVETRESLMAKTASLPRNIPQWPTLQAGSIVSDYLTNLDIRVLQQGVLQKTKLTENGKKLRKNWSSSLVVLTDLFLFIFKETKNSSHTSITSANKPELCVDLNGATIEWASVKSSRKGVFQVTTLLGLQLLLQDEDETNAVVWFNQIRRAIQRLPCGSRETMNIYPSPLPSPMTSQSKWLSQDSNRPEVLSSHLLSPPSPDGVESLTGSLSKQKKGSRLRRTRSTKVRILGSTEDLTAASSTSTASPVERQIKLRDKLRKFFVRRPTMESLKRKGIWKDEPVFGCHLQNLCAGDDTLVPKFVQRVVQLIESKPDNMKADGIYRASGNLSQVQKIRCQVDQNNWKVLEEEEDVHVLTGCLKLFFRELKEPLIPFATFEKALEITNSPSGADKIRKFKDLMETLSRENYETLKFLLKHLLNITKYREHNRMHISNLAIVFGPTITWAATESFNLALDMMQQNLVVESLLNNYMNIFT